MLIIKLMRLSVRGKLKVIFVCGISISMPHKFLFSKSLAKPTSKTRPPGVLAGVDGGWRMESLVAMCFPFSPILRCLHFYSISISTFLFLYFFFFLQPRTRKILWRQQGNRKKKENIYRGEEERETRACFSLYKMKLVSKCFCTGCDWVFMLFYTGAGDSVSISIGATPQSV